MAYCELLLKLRSNEQKGGGRDDYGGSGGETENGEWLIVQLVHDVRLLSSWQPVLFLESFPLLCRYWTVLLWSECCPAPHLLNVVKAAQDRWTCDLYQEAILASVKEDEKWDEESGKRDGEEIGGQEVRGRGAEGRKRMGAGGAWEQSLVSLYCNFCTLLNSMHLADYLTLIKGGHLSLLNFSSYGEIAKTPAIGQLSSRFDQEEAESGILKSFLDSLFIDSLEVFQLP